jgi:AhpD family alkylhydroperoxidase
VTVEGSMDRTCTLADPGKPAFNLAGFASALAGTAASLPRLLASFVGPDRLDPALREGVIVAVSRMNRCRHCTAIHSAWGESVGLAEGEPAEPLASAARYARCLLAGDDPSEAERELARQLPPEAVRQVEVVARLADFTNRCGNTWDALASRLGGEAPAASTLLGELGVLLAIAPFGAPFLLLSRFVRARRGEPVFADR